MELVRITKFRETLLIPIKQLNKKLSQELTFRNWYSIRVFYGGNCFQNNLVTIVNINSTN